MTLSLEVTGWTFARYGAVLTHRRQDESLSTDISSFKRFMSMLFKSKGAKKYYLWGNHEDRLQSAVSTSGSAIIRDYAQGLIDEIEGFLRKLGVCKILPFDADDGVLTLGPLRFIHGYVHNVNATRQQAVHYGKEGGAVLMGDSHRLEQINAPKHGGVVGWACGCLQDIPKAKYAKRRLGRSAWAKRLGLWILQRQGWLEGLACPPCQRRVVAIPPSPLSMAKKKSRKQGPPYYGAKNQVQQLRHCRAISKRSRLRRLQVLDGKQEQAKANWHSHRWRRVLLQDVLL